MPLNCKSCGAPLKGDEEHCPYCGSLVDYGDDTKLNELRNQKKEAERRKKLENLPQMKYVSEGFIITVSIFTVGLYGIYWYLSRRGDLNKLVDRVKFPDVGLAIYIISWLIFFLVPESSEDLNAIEYLILLGSAVYVAFSVKKILREYASQHLDTGIISRIIAPSDIALFFFGYVYLQIQINKMIQAEIFAPKL